jgi:hypothetical protein
MLDTVNTYLDAVFQSVNGFYHSVVDPLNPFSRGNVILFFTCIVVYTYTWVAVWRSERAWFRFICFVVNQVFTVGILIPWASTLVLTYAYWQAALATFAGTGAASLIAFRRRRR